MNLEVHTHKDRCLIEVDSHADSYVSLIEVDSHADSFVSLIEVDSQTDGCYGTHQCVVWVGCVGLQVIIIVGLQVMCRQRSNGYGY